ncbi:MAG TPA: TIGR03086 family metal-binding protein [Candidatus Dormibacteraeota bacterium]
MTAIAPASPLEVLRWACTSTRSIVDNVPRDELDATTPCGDWKVSDLIDHIVGAADFFGDLAERGESPEDREWPTPTDGDYAKVFAEQASRLLRAFATPEAMERVMELPTGPSPGSLVIQVATGEIFVHGWDLARATGQAMPHDPGVAEALWVSPWPALSAAVRAEHPSVFAPEVEVAAVRPAIDRLVAFLGRDPDWTPGA